MAEEAESELVAGIGLHLNKVKQALLSRSNMDRTIKEEAIHAVSEMDTLLNKLSGMFMGLESTLKKAFIDKEKDSARLYSEQLEASRGSKTNWPDGHRTVVQPSEVSHPTHGLIVKVPDSNTSSHETKRIIKEAVDPKALQLGVNKIKNLANDALFVECKTEKDRDTLEKELSILSTLSVGRPKKKLPTLLLSFVPKEIEDDIKNTILLQNNLAHLADPILCTKFTKRTFEDSGHVVVEVSPHLRRELLNLQKIKLQWCMCRVEDFVSVTRCLKCLGIGHSARFCQKQQKCSLCAEDHHWKECGKKNTPYAAQTAKNQTPTYKTKTRKQTQIIVYSAKSALGSAEYVESLIKSRTDC
jgi:hypothetical protein